ncbi:AIPR family protein [Sphingobium sp. CR2-8]|uniref:AIPR family protein n=1 Tax=Sphingobium sp. CR2-8 TaxID=1306534 RepID=UPI002DB9A85E|nr:AIPR family protein [Sphingobium sp. CR2-8]MEC3911021.1 AIPR family protein [Sphingobium sp. CR2-8]
MNPVIKAQVLDFAATEDIEHRAESEIFEIYSVYSILNGGLGESVDAADVHLSGNEFGVDGVAIIVQGRLVADTTDAEQAIQDIKNPEIDFYFFQSKTGTSFDYGDISKFFDSISGFFDGSMNGESPQLDDLIAAKDVLYSKGVGRRNPGLHAYYACTGNYDKPSRIEKLIVSAQSQWSDLNIFDQDRTSIQMIGAKELQRLYRAASSAVEATIEFPRNVVLPSHGSVEEAYLGYITADEVVKLVSIRDDDGNPQDINRSVFFDNIRDFDPDSKINNDIADTLQRGEAPDFIFRNNGITVVAKSIDRTGDRFRIEDYQVVNGCQTSNILFNNRTAVASVHVPFRLIGTKDDDFISSIIAGTNRQNAVREEQFWALRPFMKSFEEYCQSLDDEQRILFERRENQFRGQKVERARIMQPSTLMKAVAATLLNQPNRSARDYRGITAEYQDKLFLEEHDVRLYHAACYLHYRLDYLWRNQKLDKDFKIYRFYFMAAIGRKIIGNGDVFARRRQDIQAISAKIVDLAADEARLKATVEKTHDLLKARIAAADTGTRERLRDAIRSETFAKAFDRDLANETIPL